MGTVEDTKAVKGNEVTKVTGGFISQVVIPRGTRRELRLTMNSHGRWVAREWFETREGLRPGRGGIELSVKEVRAFYEAVETVQPRTREA